MKRTRVRLYVCLIAMALAGALFGIVPTGFRAARAQTAGFDGETLYLGMFFAAGPVAPMFPEIWDNPVMPTGLDAASRARLEEIGHQVVDAIRSADPAFLPSLAADLQSRDRLRINRALDSASVKTMDTVTPGLFSGDLSSAFVQPELGDICGTLRVTLRVRNIVHQVHSHLGERVTDIFGDRAVLPREILVNLVAERLGIG